MKNSIGLKLLRYIFGGYLVVTVVLTAWQLHSEYWDTKSDALQGMLNIQPTFEASLSEAVWGFNTKQLTLSIQGIKHIDYISGVQVLDHQGRSLAQSEGFTFTPIENSTPLKAPFESIIPVIGPKQTRHYHYQFPLFHKQKNANSMEIGQVNLLLSNEAVFQRLSYGFMLILINAGLKTLALWLIFYYFTNRLVAKPVNKLKNITQELNPETPEALRHNNALTTFLKNAENRHDEISSFARSFNQMRKAIIHKLDLIEEQNIKLEKRVIERTLELTKINKKLEALASHDDLTGLPNRKLFNERIENLSANVLRGNSSYGLLNIDLRKFKSINDNLGHQIGDAVLQEFAKRMLSITREGDTVSRLGGDEFYILLPFVNESNWRVATEKVVNALKATFHYNNHKITIAANIGVAIFPYHSNDVNSLLHMSDVAMYQSKNLNLPYCFYQKNLEKGLHLHIVNARSHDSF